MNIREILDTCMTKKQALHCHKVSNLKTSDFIFTRKHNASFILFYVWWMSVYLKPLAKIANLYEKHCFSIIYFECK